MERRVDFLWGPWLLKVANKQPSPPQTLGVDRGGVGAAYKAPATLVEPQLATNSSSMPVLSKLLTEQRV